MNSILYKNSKITFTEQGKGTAVVLLHGFLENRGMWEHLSCVLAPKYRIVAIDLLGHGDSESMGYVHTMEDNADVIAAVLAELKIRKAVIAGHSMGGYVALAFAELYPEKVKALALINSTSRADSDERKLNRDRAIKAVKKDHTSFVRLSIANLFSPANRKRLTDEIEFTKQQALKTPLQGIVASLEGMKIRKDREVLLHFAPYPILLVLGKLDPVLNYDESVDQVQNTEAQLVTFEDGHMSTIENSDQLTSVMLQFLKKT